MWWPTVSGKSRREKQRLLRREILFLSFSLFLHILYIYIYTYKNTHTTVNALMML